MKVLVAANDKLLEDSVEEHVFLNRPDGVTKLRLLPSLIPPDCTAATAATTATPSTSFNTNSRQSRKSGSQGRQGWEMHANGMFFSYILWFKLQS